MTNEELMKFEAWLSADGPHLPGALAVDARALVAEVRRLRAVFTELKMLGVDVRRRLETQQRPRLKLTNEGGLLLTALATAKVKP